MATQELTVLELLKLNKQFGEACARVQNNPGLLPVLRSALQSVIGKVFLVTTNQDLTVEEGIDEAGPFNYVNSYITSANFPIEGSGTRDDDLQLHHFDRDISDTEVNSKLDALGLERVTELSVFVAFLRDNPDLQRVFPIISGASWVDQNGNLGVVCATGAASGRRRRRRIRLYRPCPFWGDQCRFLVRHTS